MQKFGTVSFSKSNELFYLVWYTSIGGVERIDIIENLNEYDLIDTSDCVAAYFRKTTELVYGDSTVVEELLRTKRNALMFNGKCTQDIDTSSGKFRVVQEKQDQSIGMYYKVIQEDGYNVYEEYSTPECKIVIDTIKSDSGVDIPPLNIKQYKTLNSILGSTEMQVELAEYYSLEHLKAKYPLAHIEENDFVVVGSTEEARERLTRWANAPTKVKAIDLETTGVEWNAFGKDVLTGVVMSYDTDESTYYPFRQENFQFNLDLKFLEEILNAVNTQSEDVVIVAHNAKVELQGIWKEDINYVKNSEYAVAYAEKYGGTLGLVNPKLRIDADSMILSILQNPIFRRGTHALKSSVQRIENKFYLELSDVFVDHKSISFNVLPEEIVRYYACPDTANTIKVYNHLIRLLPKDELGVLALEGRLLRVTAQNEFFGLREDRKTLIDAIENNIFVTDMLKRRFQEIHRVSANINSNDVRRDIFYNKLRCKVEVRTKTGKPATSRVALKRLIETGVIKNPKLETAPPSLVDLHGKVVVKGSDLISNRYPSLVLLEQYALKEKELGALKRLERNTRQGRVTFRLNQSGAATGRQTSDAHQYSDTMKSLVLADSEEHLLWSVDFKQVELRILAFLAGQEDLIELERDMNIDIHRAILSIITGKPIWQISAKERKLGKSTNFGVVYKMSAYGLAKKNAGPAFTDEDLKLAEKSILDFYNGLPKIKQLTLRNEEELRRDGYVKTRFNRYRYFKEILDPTVPESNKRAMVRAGNNTPVQGFGADYLKMVEITMQEYIDSKGWDEKVECNGVYLPKVRIMLSIHDELLVSSHKSIPVEELIIMFKECMEMEIEGAPPFFAAPALIDNWYLGKKDAYEIDLPFRDKIIEAWNKEKKSLLTVENYLNDLNNFRAVRLKDYMEDLVSKFKTVEAVAEHVVHPELTHTLISSFYKECEGLSHLDSIKKAVECYMERRDVLKENIEEMQHIQAEDLEEDFSILEEFNSIDKFIDLDENGELIVEEDEEDDGEDDVILYETQASVVVEEPRYLFMLDEVVIDLSSYVATDSVAEMINQEIAKLSKKNGSYKVVYFIQKKLIKTELKIDYDVAALDRIFEFAKSLEV